MRKGKGDKTLGYPFGFDHSLFHVMRIILYIVLGPLWFHMLIVNQ